MYALHAVVFAALATQLERHRERKMYGKSSMCITSNTLIRSTNEGCHINARGCMFGCRRSRNQIDTINIVIPAVH